jgi:hypothetical protein
MTIHAKIQSIITTAAAVATEAATTAIVTLLRSATLEELGGLSPARAQAAAAIHAIATEVEAAATNETPRAAKRGKKGRLARRSAASIATTVGNVTNLLVRGPLRSEQIRVALNLEPREMPRVLRTGIAGKHFAILSGEKRATLYGLTKVAVAVAKTLPSLQKGPKKAPKKVPKKTAKPARKAAKKK